MPAPVENLMVIRHHHVQHRARLRCHPGHAAHHRRPSARHHRVPPHTGCRVSHPPGKPRPANRRARLMEPAIYDVASPWSNLWILGTAIFAAVWALAFTCAVTAAVAMPYLSGQSDGQTKPVSHRKE